MAYKVLISSRARDDLKVIVRFIERQNPKAAFQLGKMLIEKSLSLESFPMRGRIVPELNK